MKSNKLFGGSALALGAVVLAWAFFARPMASNTVAPSVPVESAPARSAQRELEIRTFERRVGEDPFSAADYASLARLFLERARATSNYADVLRAETAARKSLELREGHNTSTYAILTYALLDQHRFSAAYAAATRLVALEPLPPYRALLGETQMEVGRYAEAARTFRAMELVRNDLAVAPRLARWLELTGQRDRARYILYNTRARASARTDINADQLVVFHFRVGEFDLRNGYLDDAEKAFKSGLAVRPGDYRIVAQQAKLEAIRHNWRRAIELGDSAVAEALEPATLGLIADAYTELGDSVQAQDYTRAMEVAIRGQKKAFHREWSHFLLDHGLQTGEVLVEAEREIKERPDVYGYDLLAWALHKQHRDAEARQAIMKALQLGTLDASLYFHAGMIEVAARNGKAGATYLKRALEINDQWHPTQPARARFVLDSLGKV